MLKSFFSFQIFERSSLASEIGAAIHLTPNATGLLKRLGLNPEDVGAVETKQICIHLHSWFFHRHDAYYSLQLRIYTPSGDVLVKIDREESAGFWRHVGAHIQTRFLSIIVINHRLRNGCWSIERIFMRN